MYRPREGYNYTLLYPTKNLIIDHLICFVYAVLMQLGFLSLLLAVIQRPISKICIPNKIANSMLPCHQRELTSVENLKDRCGSRVWIKKMIFFIYFWCNKNVLFVGFYFNLFVSYFIQGMTSFMSQNGINQLNNFIFVLAMMQIVYSVVTMALGRAKVRILCDIIIV